MLDGGGACGQDGGMNETTSPPPIRPGLRIDDVNRGALLSAYFPVGDPLIPVDRLAIYARARVDIVELGLKAVDAFADGPVVAGSMTRAGGEGRPGEARRAALTLRGMDPGITAMAFGYAEPALMSAGADWQALDALLCLGPPGPRARIEAEAAAEGVRRVCFLTYAHDDGEVERAAGAEGFVFLQYSDGLTGLRAGLDAALPERLRRLRRGGVGRPILAGIGISTPEQIRHALDSGADGVVVGSMTVLKALEGPAALEDWLGQVRAVVDGG